MGAPCSGKSTYVCDHAAPGDIVVDFDVLAVALGSTDPHDHGHEIRMVAIEARRAAVTAAIQAHLRGHGVWIVDIDPSLRMDAYQRAGARFYLCQASRDELHRRADEARPARWHALIDDHLAKAMQPTAPKRRRHMSGTC